LRPLRRRIATACNKNKESLRKVAMLKTHGFFLEDSKNIVHSLRALEFRLDDEFLWLFHGLQIAN
jgi:hypothetical protein